MLAVIGAAIGALLASAGPPSWVSQAGVVVGKERVASDPIEMRRLAELAGGSQVAEEAATILGGDVPGADVLSRVRVSPADAGIVRVEATADSPDLVQAVAGAYATAIVEVLDGSGARLEVGSAPTAPGEEGGRPIPLWALLGLLAGTFLGAVVAVALGSGLIAFEPLRLRSRATPDPNDGAVEEVLPAEALPAPAEIVDFDSGGAVRVSLPAKGVIADLLASAGSATGGRRTLAVLAAEEADPSGAAAAAIAVAAASRGLHVLVADAHLKAPEVASLLRVESEPGLAEYLSGLAGPRRVLRRVPTVDQDRQPRELACLPAGEGESGAGVRGGRFTELVERVGKVYELVVLAGPSLAEEAADARALARVADGVLVVCGVGAERRAAAATAAAELRGGTLHGVVSMERS